MTRSLKREGGLSWETFARSLAHAARRDRVRPDDMLFPGGLALTEASRLVLIFDLEALLGREIKSCHVAPGTTAGALCDVIQREVGG